MNMDENYFGKLRKSIRNARKRVGNVGKDGKMCVKTLKRSTKLRSTYETENQGDIQLRTTKHASPYYMYSLAKVLRVGKMTSR